MGGFFGAATKNDCITDVFFGTDYHSHLGTRRGGMTSYSEDRGFQRSIHSIENSPFRTKFEDDVVNMRGKLCIGCISDTDPQPIMVRSKLGLYAICSIGIIRNSEELTEELLQNGCANFETMSSGNINSGDLIGALIAQKDNFVEGIRYAQEKIEGTISLIILTKDGIIAARDKFGRLPVVIGKRLDGYCLSTESFAFQKLGYETYRELTAGEIIKMTSDGIEILAEGDPSQMKMCTFLWTYYGYPTACYEGVNVEVMRYRNGEIMARNEIANGTMPDIDYVAGVPDSGLDAAIGYARESGIEYGMGFVRNNYVGRTFIKPTQEQRASSVGIKLNVLSETIKDKKVVMVDDSIVRGTTCADIVRLLKNAGAKEVHVRISSPTLHYPCLYGTDIPTREELTSNRHSVEELCELIGADTLGFLDKDSLGELIGACEKTYCDACFTGDYPEK